MTTGETGPVGAAAPEEPAIPVRPPLPRRDSLGLDPAAPPVRMEDLAVQHGRSGTTNAENQLEADRRLGSWLNAATNDDLLAFLAGGGGIPGEVAGWMAESEAYHMAGNPELRPSQWTQQYVLNILQRRRSEADQPAPTVPYQAKHGAPGDPNDLLGSALHALRPETGYRPVGEEVTEDVREQAEPPQKGTVYRSGDPRLR